MCTSSYTCAFYTHTHTQVHPTEVKDFFADVSQGELNVRALALGAAQSLWGFSRSVFIGSRNVDLGRVSRNNLKVFPLSIHQTQLTCAPPLFTYGQALNIHLPLLSKQKSQPAIIESSRSIQSNGREKSEPPQMLSGRRKGKCQALHSPTLRRAGKQPQNSLAGTAEESNEMLLH